MRDIIEEISKAKGVGGIGVVRILGEDAFSIAENVFKPYFGQQKGCISNLGAYRAKYGKIIHNNEFIDEAIALVFKAPNSYTGENVVEISCHGGMYLTKRLLRAVFESGARPAEPGEFTKRAFLNGKMNLSQAEAVMDLISAKGEKSNKIAYSFLEGTAGKNITKIKNNIVDIVANLSVWADYPEDEVPAVDENTLKIGVEKVYKDVVSLIKNYDTCKILKEGVKTAIVGRPNVGKSTLMNLLSGFEKSIVTDIPGTTRDVIEESVMLGDIPLLLVDTAGIRDTDNVIEQIGVKKAKESIDMSDVIFLVLDASAGILEQDRELIDKCNPKRTIVILNKCDLNKKIEKEELLSTFSDRIVEISAINGEGIEKLKEIFENIVGISDIEPSNMVISNERQLNVMNNVKKILEEALEEIDQKMTFDAVTVLLQDAVEKIMEITGESASEAVVNKIFSKFCVGK